MVRRFEYLAVRIQEGLDEKKVTERLNAVAAHGWRLVAAYHGQLPAIAIFERELDGDA